MSIFNLNDYTSLLLKCEKEFKELRNCRKHPDYEYLLINIITGMNHLFDWVLKDTTIDTDIHQHCIKQFNSYGPRDRLGGFEKAYKDVAPFPEIDPYQKAIRQLCNRSKHFKKLPNDIDVDEKEELTCLAGEPHMVCGNDAAACGAFQYVYSVDIDGEDINLIDLISVQLGKWKSFRKDHESKSGK